MTSTELSTSTMVEDQKAAPVVDVTSAAAPARTPNDATQRQRDASAAAKAEEEDYDDSWETDSYLDDLVDDQSPFEYATVSNPDTCTAEEAKAYRRRLHEVGAGNFVLETITRGTVTARKLCTAFGVALPAYFKNLPDQACYPVLGHAIAKELSKRKRLPQYKTLDDAAHLLQKSKNIMVITGAGISTSLGIPDFRSKNTGFYSKLQEMGFEDPQSVFDLTTFDEDPTMFYQLAGEIIPDLNKWSPTHQFIRLLQDKDKLLTNYTQNIDNLEAHAGIKPEKLVQCHGSWATATCRKCGYKIPGEEIFDDVKAKRVAECKHCIEQLAAAAPKPGMKRKRSSNGNGSKKKRASDDDDDSDGAYDIPQPGVMKPDITFFGEKLPEHFFDRLRKRDRDLVDLVIVIGTSMKVAPVSEVPHFIPPDVPQIYISRDPIYHINFDINLLGDCDTVVAELCRRAGWSLEHRMLPETLEVDVAQYGDNEHAHTVKARAA